MAFIVDEFHKKQLDKHKINIKTTYISADIILERNTDGKKNDDVKNGIRARKDYYIDGSLVHTETKFDSRITYTYISEDLLNPLLFNMPFIKEIVFVGSILPYKTKTILDGL